MEGVCVELSRRGWLVVAMTVFLAAWAGLPAAAQVTITDDSGPGPVGWVTFRLDDPETAFDRYLPAGVSGDEPVPVVVFLHDIGTRPERYQQTLGVAAKQLGVVVAMPRASSSRGWGFGDDMLIVQETIARLGRELPIDAQKVAIAGHGSGGSYAYLLAYLTELRFSAVFAMGPDFLPVAAVFDPAFAPAIRMYFGAEDPAFHREAPKLREQWDALGIEWEEEVRPGFGHATWPPETVIEGLRFLVDRMAPPVSSVRLCSSSEHRLCVQEGRFAVEVSYRESADRVARARVAAPRTGDSGLFWFFEPSNWELLIKVLDGCAVNGHYWVFGSASTSLDLRITVTDLAAGRSVQYRNAAGQPAPAIADVEAFATCDVAPAVPFP